jgi:hypothetical protein
MCNPAAPFQSAIFNTPAYARLHAHRFPTLPLRCIRRTPGAPAPHGVFQSIEIGPGSHASPACAPHGGFDLAPDATDADAEALIRTAEAALQQAGARTLDIIQPPLRHASAQGARTLALLCRLGYVVTRQELNQALPVDGRRFLDLGAYATRKRAAKARRLGVSTTRLGADQHRAAYDILVRNRAKKGRTLSMAWRDVAAMTEAFPDQVHLFGATQDDALIAAAITVAVTSRVLYVYAWGEQPGAEPASPVTLLAEHIHSFAAAAGFECLDLGTSSVNGVINPGLHAFKASLGAEPSLKLWLRKDLAP